MNNYQINSSYQEQPQNDNNFGGISSSIDYIKEKGLQPYVSKHSEGEIISFIGEDNILKYAFLISQGKIHQISKFELGSLKAKWLGKNKSDSFVAGLLSKPANIFQFNQKINEFISLHQNKIEKKESIKNPDFPDGTFIYKNKYKKNFKVVTLGGKVATISCDDKYITGHQKAAIQRAVNQNRLDKFAEFLPEPSIQLSVVHKTNKILEGEYLGKESGLLNSDHPNFYESIRQETLDSGNLILSAHLIENISILVENFTNNDFPSIKQLEAAQRFIAIMHTRTGVDKNIISELLQTPPTIHYMFDKIDESIGNEGYNVNFVQTLLQLSEIIKNIFLSIATTEKRAYH